MKTNIKPRNNKKQIIPRTKSSNTNYNISKTFNISSQTTDAFKTKINKNNRIKINLKYNKNYEKTKSINESNTTNYNKIKIEKKVKERCSSAKQGMRKKNNFNQKIYDKIIAFKKM